MSYLSGRHMSRDDYNRTANFVSDSPSERGVGGAQRVDDDYALLPGNHGGRGIGLAGGYSGSQSQSLRQPPSESKLSSDPAPALAGAGDDPYAGYDPGMAGCTVEQSTCHIPGVPWIGASPAQAQAQAQSPHAAPAPAPAPGMPVSRGYERDADEYADVLASWSSSSSSSVDLGTSVVDPGPVRAADTNPNPNPNPNPDPFADPDPDPSTGNPLAERPNPHPHPSIGTRLVGRVERLAGKVLRDSDIKARGKRHMVRPMSLLFVAP